MSLSQSARDKLKTVSTATLTTVLFKRGFRNTFIQGIQRLNADAPAMVGPAYTLRYIPAREDLDHLGVFEDRGHPQRKGVEECPSGHVFVIDSRRNPSAASAGGILVTRLWKRGVAGIVTDGGFRDSPEIAKLPFPAYHAAPAAPTNLIKHHAVDLDVPVACGEVPVYPGDIVVGDGEGVVVIPQHIAEAVAEEAFEQTAYEDFVQEKVREGARSSASIRRRRRRATSSSDGAPRRGAKSEHDPEKACPGLDPGWIPVFGNDHAPAKSWPQSEAAGFVPRPIANCPTGPST
jgi:regulator of RNase E activity RraA